MIDAASMSVSAIMACRLLSSTSAA